MSLSVGGGFLISQGVKILADVFTSVGKEVAQALVEEITEGLYSKALQEMNKYINKNVELPEILKDGLNAATMRGAFTLRSKLSSGYKTFRNNVYEQKNKIEEEIKTEMKFEKR